MKTKSISAAIFDMDGLLIDSEPFWRRAEIETFAEVGVTLSWEECGETLGRRIDEVVEYWRQRRPWKESDGEKLEEKIIARVIELIRNDGTAKPGMREILNFFHRKHIPIALCSGSYFSIIDAVVDRLEIRGYFSVLHSAELEKRGKPAPDVYLGACRRLGVSPESAIAFEDSPSGIRSAKSAGLRCVAVPEQQLAPDIASLADMLLPSLEHFGEAQFRSLSGDS